MEGRGEGEVRMGIEARCEGPRGTWKGERGGEWDGIGEGDG